jgi:HEAT repeat protein
MGYPVREAPVLLYLWAAYCLVTIDITVVRTQNVNLTAQSATTTLLKEFKTAQYFWQQAEIGEKLVALYDRSIVPAMLELLGSESRAERCNAGRVLAGLGDDRGLIAVIAELNDKEPRQNRPESCASCKSPYSPGQIIQDRYYAAHVLRTIGDKRAVPALIETLKDENINYQAAIVLGNLGDERAVPALLDALERARTEPRNPSSMRMDLGLWAGYALLGLKHPTGLSTVVEFLRPEYGENLRRHAVDALGKFCENDAVPFLINALRDTDAEVRVNAIMALGRIGDKSAVPALKELLKNNDQAEGRARLRYEPPNPLFKLMTVHEAATKIIHNLEVMK